MADRNNTRAGVSAKLRFEVFKRDKFTCTYCGATAAQKLLHCDHIKPVAEGGASTLLNLTTACVDCNLGKGARLLSDDSAMAIQHRQLADLEERRQQLEMMRQWREELEAHTVSEVDIVADTIAARSEWRPNDKGRNNLRRLIKKHGLVEVLEASGEAFDMYFRDGSQEDWDAAFRKIGLVVHMRGQEKADPNIRKLLYIQGILRKRFGNHDDYVDKIREIVSKGYPVATIEEIAKKASDWGDYVARLNAWNKARAAQPAPEPEEEQDEDEEADIAVEEHFIAWRDAGWHIQIFAQCLEPEGAGWLLKILGDGCPDGGYFKDEDFGRDGALLLRGALAVGLVRTMTAGADICRLTDDGKWLCNFVVIYPTMREIGTAFNRHGALRLGFWDRPRSFARVDQVH